MDNYGIAKANPGAAPAEGRRNHNPIGNRMMKAEPSQKGNPHLAARRAEKAALLPRAAELAAAGRSYREIAAALGIAKSTVCQWLRGRPLGRAAAQALGTPRMTAKLAARYESLYHRALREWNRSKADRRTQTVVTSEPAEGRPTTTTTLRTEPRTGNAACLGKALAAMKALEGLHCRERSRREWLENLKSDAADSDAAGKEDGLTQTVKTSMTRSGRKVRTVVTTRSDAGRLAALRDAQKVLDEKRRALETRLDVEERAVDYETCANEPTCAALKAERTALACSPAIAPDQQGGEAARPAQPAPISRKENTLSADSGERSGAAVPAAQMAEGAPGQPGRPHHKPGGVPGIGAADSGSTRSANGSPAGMPRNRRKSFLPHDLPLPGFDFASVRRSTTLPNDVFQKGGVGKGRKKVKGGRGKPVSPPAQESVPRRGSAATLRQELDQVFK